MRVLDAALGLCGAAGLGVMAFTSLCLVSQGCGGASSLTPPQTEALQSGLDLNLAVREECSDAGPYKPSRVRAMEYGAYCAVGGVLASLGSPPDAGIVCPSAAK